MSHHFALCQGNWATGPVVLFRFRWNGNHHNIENILYHRSQLCILQTTECLHFIPFHANESRSVDNAIHGDNTRSWLVASLRVVCAPLINDNANFSFINNSTQNRQRLWWNPIWSITLNRHHIAIKHTNNNTQKWVVWFAAFEFHWPATRSQCVCVCVFVCVFLFFFFGFIKSKLT